MDTDQQKKTTSRAFDAKAAKKKERAQSKKGSYGITQSIQEARANWLIFRSC
jgi:hypothetical protein